MSFEGGAKAEVVKWRYETLLSGRRDYVDTEDGDDKNGVLFVKS